VQIGFRQYESCYLSGILVLQDVGRIGHFFILFVLVLLHDAVQKSLEWETPQRDFMNGTIITLHRLLVSQSGMWHNYHKYEKRYQLNRPTFLCSVSTFPTSLCMFVIFMFESNTSRREL
jgi:hypothetical protein